MRRPLLARYSARVVTCLLFNLTTGRLDHVILGVHTVADVDLVVRHIEDSVAEDFVYRDNPITSADEENRALLPSL